MNQLAAQHADEVGRYIEWSKTLGEHVTRQRRHERIMPQEWESRREVPNPSVKDAADQYEQARLILSRNPPGTGVVLPTMNAAAMAIELYLKCLSAEVIHVPEEEPIKTGIPNIDEVKSYRVCAQAKAGHHDFKRILCGIEDDIQRHLEDSYKAETNRKLQDDLSLICDALTKSRYPYEPCQDPPDGDFQALMFLSPFLRSFVNNLEPRETIRWKNKAATGPRTRVRVMGRHL